ncbi:MAG: hypothetical protein KBT05_07325 [Bacteroidales bacterium]|nr:hypothetical protein [Candidatus Cryptobacteroides caccocaballi]
MKKTIMIILAVVLGSIAANAQIASEMYRHRNNLYIDGEKLSSEQVLGLIGSEKYYDTFVGAQKQYRSGKALVISGACTLGVGIVVSGIGLGGLDSDTYVCGMAINILGSLLLDAGIPLLCIGKSRINWCSQDYNKSNFADSHDEHSPAVAISFGAQQHGTGISLRF